MSPGRSLINPITIRTRTAPTPGLDVRKTTRRPDMPGKRVQFDDETWQALDLLARDQMKTIQELAQKPSLTSSRTVDLKMRCAEVPVTAPRSINYGQRKRR
jgi:hypothetical protein